MKNEEDKLSRQSLWTTWEDLLLSCAVKRYGLSDWSTVAMELQSRPSNIPIHLFTAQICRNKFQDLKRRFTVSGSGEVEIVACDTTVPWLDELRNLRIAELRDIVEGRGISIQSLDSKVKRLEEERERSGKEDDIGKQKPDLEEERSESDTPDVSPAKDEVVGDSVSGERSDKDYRSVNESNSTENRRTGEKVLEEEKMVKIELVQTGSVKHDDPDGKPVQTDSRNDSSKPSEEKKTDNESSKVRDSAAMESKECSKDGNEAHSQSSNSSGGRYGNGEEPLMSESNGNTTSRDSVEKSKLLVRFLNLIRSSKHGSVFDVRLQSQKTEKYESMIRQHVDLETVQTRVNNGSYSSCTTKFYSDLLLLFNNAIVFFSKSSLESSAAFELRKLVLKELKNKQSVQQPNSSPESAPSTVIKPNPHPERSDPLPAKQKTPAPLVVCRKRSFISGNPSSSNRIPRQDDKPLVNTKPPPATTSSSSPYEEESSMKLKLKEKPVTGVRSMRRSSTTRINNTNMSAKNTTNPSTKTPITNASTNPGSSAINGSEAPKAENKKKTDQLVKKHEVVDFLKRIKKSSPVKGTLLDTLNNSPQKNNASSKRETIEQTKKKVDERIESTTGRQNGSGGDGIGGSGIQAKEEEVSPLKRNVGRPPKRGREAVPEKRGKEAVEEEATAKRPNKRSKR